MSATVHVREAFFIRKKDIPERVVEKIIDHNRFLFFEDKACAKCEWLDQRPCDVCENCAAFKGGSELAHEVKIGKKTYVRAPIGDRAGLEKILEKAGVEFKYKSHLPDVPMKKRVKFTGTLRDYQPKCVDAIIKKKRGVLKAPPRSGKTVMSTAAICKIGKKTIIMAAQRDWLVGFRETFIGSKTQKALTNIDPSRIGFATKYEDFVKYDVCLVTVQTFWSPKGQKLLRKIRDMFSVLVIDEIHTGAAPKFALVLANLNCQYKIGLSGTPNRKDGKYVLVDRLIGGVIYEAKVQQLRPHVRLVRTKYSRHIKGNVPWVRMVSGLEKDPQRLKLIAQWAIKDAKDGHMVLIPFSQVTPIKALVLAINRLAGRDIAYPFYGGLKKKQRDDYIEKARRYKIRILVGNAKLLSTGINIPRASCLYDVSMSSNKENAIQRIARILTPWDDKPQPIVRYFLDDMSVRRNCLRNEWFQAMMPIFKPVISEKDHIALKSYFSNKERGGRVEL